jgi:hypothetical protein
MSRYIPTEREPIKIGEQSFGTRELIEFASNNYEPFNSNLAGAKASMKIETALEKHAGLPYLELQEEPWQMLCTALREPKVNGQAAGYPVRPARSILPHINDVLEAKDEKPEEQKAAE